MHQIVAIVQARLSSRRLYGKVLLDIAGKPMLQRVIERVSEARSLSRVIVATSTDKSDDAIAAFCNGHKYDYYRGSLDDVLDRFWRCTREAKASVVVRITADCPLIAPQVISLVGEQFRLNAFINAVATDVSYRTRRDSRSRLNYVTNTNPPTFPDGLDCEWISFGALRLAHSEARRDSDREHVTSWIRRNVQGCNVVWHRDLSHYRLCVDEQADLDLVRAIYAELGDNPYWLDVVDLLDQRPDLVALNAHIRRNEGMER